jgi:predicted RNase H-like HicB family nuclease
MDTRSRFSKVASYIAILRKDRHTDYGVSFPDLPGCVAVGRTLEQARKSAAQALAMHLEGLAVEGMTVPAPRALDKILVEREHRDGVPFLVDAQSPKSRAVRVNITLPKKVLDSVDGFARKTGTSRSALLAEAAIAWIGSGRRRRPKAA